MKYHLRGLALTGMTAILFQPRRWHWAVTSVACGWREMNTLHSAWLDSLGFSLCPVWPPSQTPERERERLSHCCYCMMSSDRFSGTWGGEGGSSWNGLPHKLIELTYWTSCHQSSQVDFISWSFFTSELFCLGNTTKYNLPVLERGWRTLACKCNHEKNTVHASVTDATGQYLKIPPTAAHLSTYSICLCGRVLFIPRTDV